MNFTDILKKISDLAKPNGWVQVAAPEALKLAKSVAQAPQRALTSVGIQPAADILSLATGKKIEPVFQPKGKFQQAVLGKEPITGIFKKVTDTQELLNKYSPVKGSVGKGINLGLSPLIVAGLTAGDLTPFGGEKNVAEKSLVRIAESSSKSEIANLLQKGFKIAEERIPFLSEQLSKITKLDEVKNIVGTAEKQFSKERGFITSIKEQLPELKVAGQYIPRDTDTLAIKANNLIKDDLIGAERLALSGTDDKAVATASQLLKHYNEQAIQATDEAVRNALYEKAANLANVTARNLTEQGRSIQAASILGRLTPEGQVKFAAREIQKYNEGAKITQKIPELTGDQAKYITKEMNEIGSMEDGIEKAMRFKKLQDYISELVPSPLMKKVTNIWKAGLLTGIKTTGLNVMANLSHMGTEIAKDIPATAIDSVASLFTKQRTIGLTLKGTGTGLLEGFTKGMRYLKTGFDERDVLSKLDVLKVNYGKGKIAQGLKTYEDTIFRLMGAEDQPFYYGAKARSIASQAIAKAKTLGLKGAEYAQKIDELIKNPTDDMVRNSVLDAETAVFQNKTVLGTAARAIQKLPGGEIVLPFGKTPSAVATQIINYSPIGLVKTIVQNLGKGNFDQRLFSQGLGRSITGMGALYLGYELAKKGLITLARPSTEREKKQWDLEGKVPNSVKIGNKWRSIGVLGPVGQVLLMGGAFQNAMATSGSPTEAMSKTLASVTQSFTQQTFLTGVSRFIDAISDPERSAKSVASSMLSSVIPTIVGDVARATDTVERRTEKIYDYFKSKIPGVRQTLEPQVTSLGKEKPITGNILEVMADPTRPSKSQTSPLIEELGRLSKAGFSVTPTLLGDKNGYKSLTPKQNTELWEMSGKIIDTKLSNLIQQPEYIQMDDEQRAKTIDKIVSQAKIIARVSSVIEITKGLKDQELINKLSELKKSGLLTQEVFNAWQELR